MVSLHSGQFVCWTGDLWWWERRVPDRALLCLRFGTAIISTKEATEHRRFLTTALMIVPYCQSVNREASPFWHFFEKCQEGGVSCLRQRPPTGGRGAYAHTFQLRVAAVILERIKNGVGQNSRPPHRRGPGGKMLTSYLITRVYGEETNSATSMV